MSRCADRPIHDAYGQTVRAVDAGVPHFATTIDGDGDGDDGDDGARAKKRRARLEARDARLEARGATRRGDGDVDGGGRASGRTRAVRGGRSHERAQGVRARAGER